MLFGLHIADFIALGLYFLLITGIGVYLAKKVHTMTDFFMPRKYGKTMLLFHAFGTGSHSDQAVSVAAKSYTNGMSGIWYQWVWLFVSPFYWLLAPILRRFRCITTSDVYELRYNRSVAVLFAVVGTLSLAYGMGMMLRGTSEVITGVAGFKDPMYTNYVIGIMTVLFVIYGAAGGMSAAVVTDFIQGILTILFSFMLLPSILHAVGGFAGMRATIDNPEMFSLIAPTEITLFYICVVAFNNLVAIVAYPNFIGNVGPSKTEMDSRVAQMGGSIVKRICTVAWSITGLAALAYYSAPATAKVVNPDHIYGMVAQDFLPNIMPGLVGLFLASMLATVMASCDSFMVCSSGLFTENVYKPVFKDKSQRHYVWVGRISSVIIVAIGIFFAYVMKDVRTMLEIFWKISPSMGVAFWLGFFWRRATVAGAWASTLAGFAAWLLTTMDGFINLVASLPFADALGLIFMKGDNPTIYLPWQMLFYISVGIIAGIAVSLFTRPVSEDKLEKFYGLVRTPVYKGEVIDEPLSLPQGMEYAPRRPLFRLRNFEIMKPSRISMIGFGVGWAIVILFIFGCYAIVNL